MKIYVITRPIKDVQDLIAPGPVEYDIKEYLLRPFLCIG